MTARSITAASLHLAHTDGDLVKAVLRDDVNSSGQSSSSRYKKGAGRDSWSRIHRNDRGRPTEIDSTPNLIFSALDRLESYCQSLFGPILHRRCLRNTESIAGK